MKRVALEFRGVTLETQARVALRDFYLTVYAGEYVAILGADGSGKDVLARAVMGEAVTSQGEIYADGSLYAPRGILEAHRRKVFLIPQNGGLIDTQSLAENIFLNHGGTRSWRVVNDSSILEETKRIFEAFDLNFDPRSLAGEYSRSMKCVIEMIKWYAHGARALLLDNAFSSATQGECAVFMRVLEKIKSGGTAVIHMMNRCLELFGVADKCVLLSAQGRPVRTIYPDEFDRERINTYIGRRKNHPPISVPSVRQGTELFRAEGVSAGNCRGVSFTLHQGEILGLYCRGGQDRDAIAYAMCGERPYEGQFYLDGKPINIKGVWYAVRRGIGLLPSDPKKLFYPDLTRTENAVMPLIRRMSNAFSIVNAGRLRAANQDARDCLESLDDIFSIEEDEKSVAAVLSRFMLYPYRVIVLPHPGAINDVHKEDMVYHLIGEAAKRGCSLVIASTNLQELERFCSNVCVLE